MREISGLLDGLRTAVQDDVLAASEPFRAVAGEVVPDRADDLPVAHLPHRGVLASLTLLSDGRGLATRLVGRDGATPLDLEAAARPTRRRVVALTEVRGRRMPLARLHALAMTHPELRARLDRQAIRAAQSAEAQIACIAHHELRERLAALLLDLSDRVGSDRLMMIQQDLADVLGVRRSSVNEAAVELRTQGALRYARGNIHVTDRERLERAACTCRFEC